MVFFLTAYTQTATGRLKDSTNVAAGAGGGWQPNETTRRKENANSVGKLLKQTAHTRTEVAGGTQTNTNNNNSTHTHTKNGKIYTKPRTTACMRKLIRVYARSRKAGQVKARVHLQSSFIVALHANTWQAEWVAAPPTTGKLLAPFGHWQLYAMRSDPK